VGSPFGWVLWVETKRAAHGMWTALFGERLLRLVNQLVLSVGAKEMLQMLVKMLDHVVQGHACSLP
jgi:hypothetical protein